MKKIVLLPLDERPCNYIYPQNMFNNDDIHITVPDMSIMGNKKTPGDHEKIVEFLLEETKDAYGLVLSVDTLLYGGILPSRLHYFTEEELKERLSVIRKIRENNPDLIIYAFNLIMRCPQYSSSDEEPDYYEYCGLEIFKYGYYNHKKELGVITDEEQKAFDSMQVPEKEVQDFLHRRETNCALNIAALDLVEEKIIDFLIIPQDDSSEFGWTAIDQRKISKIISKKNLQLSVYMYPGADEVANTLLSKMVLKIEKKRPLFYVKYNSVSAPRTIPFLEDRYLDLTVNYQILAAGGLITQNLSEADIVLCVNANGISMMEKSTLDHECDRGMTTFRNMPEFMEFMDYCVNDLHKKVAVADVATINGSDYELIAMMQQKDLLLKVASYAGWNTSSNTLGTCIPHAVVNYLYGNTKAHYDFLVSRYIEDFAYMTCVRAKVLATLEARGMNYFSVDGQRGVVAQEVKAEIEAFIPEYLQSIQDHYVIHDCYMPWSRMFEVGILASYK